MRNEQAEEELSHVLKNNSFTWKHYGKKLSAGWNWKKPMVQQMFVHYLAKNKKK